MFEYLKSEQFFWIMLVICITGYSAWKRYLEYKQNKKFDS